MLFFLMAAEVKIFYECGLFGVFIAIAFVGVSGARVVL